MNKTIACCVASALLWAPVVLAQTPDGETPPNEGVCDELQADGVTKGLYGLCIAFCEARDYASRDEPITAEDLDALLDMKPGGKLLAKYNTKKQVGDPEMPCIKFEEPCPCWTADELASIDGIMYNTTQATKVYCEYIDQDYIGEFKRSYLYESSRDETVGDYYSVAGTSQIDRYGGQAGWCRYDNHRNDVGRPSTSIVLFTDGGGVTYQQLDSCRTAVQNQIDNIINSCTEVYIPY